MVRSRATSTISFGQNVAYLNYLGPAQSSKWVARFGCPPWHFTSPRPSGKPCYRQIVGSPVHSFAKNSSLNKIYWFIDAHFSIIQQQNSMQCFCKSKRFLKFRLTLLANCWRFKPRYFSPRIIVFIFKLNYLACAIKWWVVLMKLTHKV